MYIDFEEQVREYAAKLSTDDQAQILLVVMRLADDPWCTEYREIEHEDEDGETYDTFEVDVPETNKILAFSVSESDSLISLTELRVTD